MFPVHKRSVSCAACAILLVILSVYTYFSSDALLKYEGAKYARQRNKLSRMLNTVAHEKAILQCELQKLKNGFKPISETGGWCEETAMGNAYRHKTDEELVKALAKFFAGKKVGSFGDGRGDYKVALDKIGSLISYDAYDGGPYYDKLSNGQVKFLDLALPQFGLPLYDWVMSLEVAEHIPKQYEQIYINNIIHHAKEGIVLSWAVPNQTGHFHVNNQPLEYVVQLLDNLGFYHDPDASYQLQQASNVSWLRQNTNVYRRKPNYIVDETEL